MQIDKLSVLQRQKYDALEEAIFARKRLDELSLKNLCKELDIPYNNSLKWFSHMLKHYNPAMSAPRCPSCNKRKSEVSDMTVCRDVFHYL